MTLNDGDIIELVRKVKACVESGDVEDFEEIINNYDFSGIYFFNNYADRFAVDFIFCDLAVAYLRRFPAEFIKNDRAKFFMNSLEYLLIKSIGNKNELAFEIADVILESSTKDFFIPMCFIYSVGSGWYEFLLHCLERIEKPWSYIGDKELSYVAVLLDEQRYELLDKLFCGISEDELFEVIEDVLLIYDEGSGKTGVECFCELADRYGTAAGGGNERVVAELEQQECRLLNISEPPISNYYIRSWEYMRKRGIRLHNASCLIYFIPEYHDNEADTVRILKEYINPLWADDVYIDIFMLMGENVAEFLQILDVIGKVRDRVYIDLTNKTFPVLSDFARGKDFRDKLTYLVKEGFPLRTEQDFAESYAAKSLINVPRTLEVVLRNGEFSDEQLTEFAGMCTTEKKLNALNVVRKILDGRASSNLKKKRKNDDV